MFRFTQLFAGRGDRARHSAARRYLPKIEVLEGRALPSVFTVTNTSPDPASAGSLPWAVAQANGHPGLDFIHFNIGGGGAQVITLQALPDQPDPQLWLDDQVVIDGTSQPGYRGTPLISVQGIAAPAVPGIFILNGAASSDSTIQGLDIYSYSLHGVTIGNGSLGNWIQNDWIGFYRDPAGAVHLDSTAFGASTIGVTLQSSFDTIRSDTISGNYNALALGENIAGTWSGQVYHANGFSGNFIGTDPTGTFSYGYGNLSNGAFFGEGAQANWFGPGNVVSGNGTNAIELMHSSVVGNVVFGNEIGTDVTGMGSIPNGWAVPGGGVGVLVGNGASGNAIGGPAGGNVISGNGSAGVALGYTGPGGDDGPGNGNWVEFNIIGLNGKQTGVAGSQTIGVQILGSSMLNSVLGNIVAGNRGSGIDVSNSQHNNTSYNSIGESALLTAIPNGGFGVELDPGASFNWILSNGFGPNARGNLYVDPQAIGNDIA